MIKGQSELLLEMIAISGELPVGQSNIFFNNESYRRQIISSLKSKNYIRVYSKDGLKGYRLTGQAKKYLLDENIQRFTFYITGVVETNKIRGDYSRRLRLHCLSEVLVLMHCADIAIFRDKKLDIFSSDFIFPTLGQANIFRDAAYYNSREVKALGESTIKINNSRFTGVLMTSQDVFLVYNTRNSVMKWNYKSELRAKALLNSYVLREKLSSFYKNKEVKAIVIGENMEMAYTLLTTGGKTKKNFFVVDGTFDSFLFIPNDGNGETLLRLITNETITASLDSTLRKDLKPKNNHHNIDNDATDQNGNPVLFAYNMDLPRIAKFNASLYIKKLRGVIICFDFQKDVLARYCGDEVSFQTISKIKFERGFFV